MRQNLKNETQEPYSENGIKEGAAVAGMQGVAAVEQPLSLATLESGLKELFGDDFDINDNVAQEALLQHLRVNREQNERLAGALERDPRLAQMLVDMIEGKRNAHSAMARYFGRSVMNIDENSPEFEEVMRADEEHRDELLRNATERRNYEDNLNASRGVIENFCRERGYDAATFMNDVWDKLVMPILSGNYTYDVCTALEHAINYEQDVEDAFAAGDIKGRNTNIQRMKENFGDGLPKGMSSAAPDATAKRRRNPLIEDALQA